MRRFWFLLVVALVVSLSICVAAQDKGHEQAAPAKAGFDKAVMQQVWDAWCTLDPKNVAKFYGKEKSHVFYDITPLQYHGWDEYEAGVKPVIAQWKSAKCKVNYDGQIREESPTMAWSASTVQMNAIKQDGSPDNMTVRWTAIWHKHGANWVIAHEHVSVPAK